MKTGAIKNWEIKTSTGSHFDVLDGIRGMAILMVVAFHTFYVNPNSGPLLRSIGSLIETGWMGVPIFFVLSGFLISYPFFRLRNTDKQHWYPEGYASRRIGKIIPPYYLSIVAFAALYLFRFQDPAYLTVALKWALGLPNFIYTELRFNASYWSLIVEAHFYILIPFLFFLTRRLNVRQTAISLFLLLFVVPMIVRYITWPADDLGKDLIGFLMQRFPCALDYFAWGVLFSGVFVSLSTGRDALRALSLFGYLGFFLLVVSLGCWALWIRQFDIHDNPVRWGTEVFHLLPGVSAFLMLFFIFDPQCMGARLLSRPWLRFIGIVSYEWFLFHQPIVYLFQDLFGRTRGNLFLFALKTVFPLILTFLASVLIYRYFSLPLLNRIRGSKPKEKVTAKELVETATSK